MTNNTTIIPIEEIVEFEGFCIPMWVIIQEDAYHHQIKHFRLLYMTLMEPHYDIKKKRSIIIHIMG